VMLYIFNNVELDWTLFLATAAIAVPTPTKNL